MATLSASLSTRVDARGKSEILLRFVGGRDHIYRVHSRLFVSPSRWKDGAIIIPRLETDEQKELMKLKADLDGLVAFLLTEFHAADHNVVDRAWMQDAVDRYHHPDRLGRTDFFALLNEFYRSQDVGTIRLKHYDVTIRALKRYQVVSGKRLAVETISKETLEGFHTFLADEHKIAARKEYRNLEIYKGMAPPEERGKNSIIDYMKVLRTFCRWLERRNLLRSDPFKNYVIGTAVYGTPFYITIEERDRLYRTNLSRHPSLAAQRDIFVFQCLVGCRVGDLIALKKKDIIDGVLTYIPRKTIDNRPRVIRVPLNDTALEIVARYAGFDGERLLPFISTQKYNDAIKRCFLAARITRQVAILDPLTRKEVKRPLNEVASSHLARRTFIGNLYKQVQDPDLISSMSGHAEGSRAFARYRDIDDDMKSGLVKKLDKTNKE